MFARRTCRRCVRCGGVFNRRSGLVVVALIAAGCARWLPAPVPMKSLAYPVGAERARCLLVMLPGAGDGAGTFEKHGFVEAVRARRLSVDVVAANATMGYYFKGLLVDRLRADVLEAHKARGYAQTWFLGISMGGMGSLMTADRWEGVADGLVLFAPYLGDEKLVAEVEAAGGLAKWNPGPLDARFDEETYQRHVWAWLKRATAEGKPELYLGYGTDDRMGRAARVLGQALPDGHVATAPGGHDWPPWNKLWGDLLDHSAFAAACAGGLGFPRR